MIDGLARERVALRSEAGALRARVGSLTSAATRARSLIAEMDELRSDSAFGGVQPARQAAADPSAKAPTTVPLPKPKPSR
jgi:hypothetical protein